MLLTAAKLALGPLLIVQGRRVRRRALLLPEATGPRAGATGSGAHVLRLLVVGDSATAGVGAPTQADALAGRLAEALAARSPSRTTVAWRLVARTGTTTADALALLDAACAGADGVPSADVAVIGVGVNDVTAQRPVGRWLRDMEALARRLVERHGARLVVVSGLPPMHRFPLLPQPLRWYLGASARRYDRALQAWAHARPATIHVPLPALDDPAAMAADGFHPGPPAYRAWGDALAEAITARPTRST